MRARLEPSLYLIYSGLLGFGWNEMKSTFYTMNSSSNRHIKDIDIDIEKAYDFAHRP